MKNFVFISPNFPDNYWNFCRRLKENGLNVLGIGDLRRSDGGAPLVAERILQGLLAGKL